MIVPNDLFTPAVAMTLAEALPRAVCLSYALGTIKLFDMLKIAGSASNISIE